MTSEQQVRRSTLRRVSWTIKTMASEFGLDEVNAERLSRGLSRSKVMIAPEGQHPADEEKAW